MQYLSCYTPYDLVKLSLLSSSGEKLSTREMPQSDLTEMLWASARPFLKGKKSVEPVRDIPLGLRMVIDLSPRRKS
jgi:hypothetical protein